MEWNEIFVFPIVNLIYFDIQISTELEIQSPDREDNAWPNLRFFRSFFDEATDTDSKDT